MSLHTRRHLLGAAVGSVAGACVAASLIPTSLARAQVPAVGSVAPLGDDLYILSAGATNVVALADADGVVLVDGGAAAESDALLAAVQALSHAPVHTLFNTHWHPEHTGLNDRLGRAGATIVAQVNTRLWLTTDVTWPWDGTTFDPLPEIAQPNDTVFDRGERQAGARRIEYGYLRQAPHTDGDLYVYFPHANVLAVGDAVTGGGWPLIDWWTGGWIGGMVGGLEMLLSLTDAETRVVPARGPILGRADLQRQYEMYGTIFERLAELLYGGRGPEEAVAARPTREFDEQMGNGDEFVRRAFESLWGYLSPDA